MYKLIGSGIATTGSGIAATGSGIAATGSGTCMATTGSGIAIGTVLSTGANDVGFTISTHVL